MTHEGREGLCGAFPRKPFVDTAVITCRGGESGEEGGREGVAQNLIALVICLGGQASSSELTGHSETTASLSLNIKLACLCP